MSTANVDLSTIWVRALELIEPRLPRASYETLLRDAKPLEVDQQKLLVGVRNAFARERLQTKFAGLLRDVMRSVTNRDVAIEFVVPGGAEQPEPPPSELPLRIAAVQPSLNDYKPLNPRYVFETFVIGHGNRFAHAAALAVANAPARAYNPLFIYGGVGLGKTHLMHAIGHAVLSGHPSARIAYVSTETFTNEFINSLRDNKTAEFKNRYRNVDVLLIDDVQFLQGKESTQEEFYHTFNAIHEAHKQIVISSDRPPKEIPTLEERLRSRFEWGLICDIQPPDLETRIAILRKKAERDLLPVPDDVIIYIASRIDKNIRELEGALIRVVASSSLTQRQITLDVAIDALKDILPDSKPRPVTVDLIQQRVAEHFNLTVDDFKARKRTHALAHPRQIAMYLARELTELSLPRIGEAFGGRDHTTVMHACEKIGRDIQSDPEVASAIASLRSRILAH